MPLLRASSWLRALSLALCVGFACSDPADRRNPGSAGEAGSGIDGGASGGDTAGADAGGTVHGGGAGAAGDGGGGELGGSPGGGAAGAIDSGGNGGLGGAGGTSSENAGAGAGAGGTEIAGAGVGGEAGEGTSGRPLEVELGEFSEASPPDPLNPKLVPAIEELFAEPSIMNGASTLLGVRTAAPLVPPRFLLSLADGEGHYLVEATESEEAGDNLYEIVLHVARYVTLPTLAIRIAPMDARGNIGAYQNVVYSMIHVGRGDVVVTLTIDQPADLDVSVIEPSGFEISYQLPISPTGGQLERDSNASCELSDGSAGAANGGAAGEGGGPEPNVERVWWPTDFAPTGLYEIYVKNYDDCGVAPVTFSVNVRNGSARASYTGRFPINSIGESIRVAEFEHR